MKTQLDFCYGVNAVADDIILKEGEPVQRFFPRHNAAGEDWLDHEAVDGGISSLDGNGQVQVIFNII